MKKKLFLLFTMNFFLLISNLSSQTCNIESAYTIESRQITEKSILEAIKSSSKEFDEGYLNSIKINVNKCNAQSAQQIDELNARYNYLTELRKKLITNEDLKKIDAELRQQESKEKGIKNTLKKDFARVEKKALYCVLLKDIENIRDMSRPDLNDMGRLALSSKAAEEYIGLYINSLSSIQDYGKINEVIESFTNATIKEQDNKSIVNYGKKYYLYIVEVILTPNENRIETMSRDKSKVPLITNLEISNDYATKLQANGVTEEHIQSIRSFVETKKALTVLKNNEARKKQEAYVKSAVEQLNIISKEVKELQKKISQRSLEIKNICDELKINYDKNNPDYSAELATKKLEEESCNLNQEWISVKEKEIIYMEATPFTIVHQAVSDISKKTEELYYKISDQYGQIQEVEVYCRIENGSLTEYNEKYEQKVFREVEKIWIYPIPLDGDSYKVAVFAKFKITDKTIQKKTDPDNIDLDNDGVMDVDDRCPELKGSSSLQGCPDRDGDGVADIDDNCPDTPGKVELKGCLKKDEETKTNSNLNIDSDGDGIIDRLDACPNIKGSRNRSGCPRKFESRNIGFNAHFFKDRYDNCIDVGINFLSDSDFRYRGFGISVGARSYDYETETEAFLRVNYDYSIGLLLLSIDSKLSRNLVSIQPKAGFTVGLAYVQIGYELSNTGQYVGLNIGVNINKSTMRYMENIY